MPKSPRRKFLMIRNKEEEIIRWNSHLSDDIQIHLILTEDERSKDFNQFCEDLSRLAPKIHISKETDESERLPAIHIYTSSGKETAPSLRYQAIPLGTELEPFLEALTLNQTCGFLETPQVFMPYLDKINIPVELTLYVSQHCPFCPEAVRRLLPLAAANKFIRITVRDGFLFPETAKADNIQSAPTILLDKNFRWTGSVDLKELLEAIVNRDPSQLSASSLEAMLKEGNASQVATMMTDYGKIFPAFFDLLSSEKWSVRLGAMTVMEEIAENQRELAAQVITPLWERFHQAKDQVKGDILYVFGEAGNSETLSLLKTVLNGDYHSEVKEAAREAIEKIAKNL